jgi:ABC-type antimicrobial peptide transport system permease subunit
MGGGNMLGNMKIIAGFAALNAKSRKHRTRILSALVVTGLFLFLIVNSLVVSIVEGIEDIQDKPYGRVCVINTDAEHYDEEMQMYQKQYADSDMVTDILWFSMECQVQWENADIIGQSEQTMNFITYVPSMADYVITGKSVPKQGEMLAPKYLYGMGIYNNYTYADGEALLGETISFTVKNDYTDESKVVSYKVVGIYDNVKSGTGSEDFCITESDSMEIRRYMSEYNYELCIKQAMEAYGLTEEDMEEGGAADWSPYIAFCIAKDYPLEQAVDKIAEETGYWATLFSTPSGDITEYYEFLIFLGNILVGMLAAAAAIVLIVTILRDIRERRAQYALCYVIGYTKNIQYCAFVIEKIWMLIKACLIGAVLAAVALLAGNYVIAHITPFYMRDIVLRVHWKTTFLAAAAVVGSGLLCSVAALVGMNGICPAEVLKKEA